MNCFAHLAYDPTGIPNGSHVDVVGIVHRLLPRIVSHRYGSVSYTGNPRIAHHADNFGLRVVDDRGPLLWIAESLSQRIAVRKVSASHRFIDHSDFRRPFAVTYIQFPPR